MFENRLLWRIFGPERDEETGEWRILHNEELNDLYCSPNIIRMHVARMGDRRDVCRVLVRPEGKRPLGRPSRRWDDNS